MNILVEVAVVVEAVELGRTRWPQARGALIRLVVAAWRCLRSLAALLRRLPGRSATRRVRMRSTAGESRRVLLRRRLDWRQLDWRQLDWWQRV